MRASEYLAAVRHRAVGIQVDAVLDQDAGTDPRVAANVHPVADHGAPADAHAVPDHRPVTDGRVPVNPAPVSNPAAGTYPGAVFHVTHGTDPGAVSHRGSRCDESAAVVVAGIPGDLPGVVLE